MYVCMYVSSTYGQHPSSQACRRACKSSCLTQRPPSSCAAWCAEKLLPGFRVVINDGPQGCEYQAATKYMHCCGQQQQQGFSAFLQSLPAACILSNADIGDRPDPTAILESLCIRSARFWDCMSGVHALYAFSCSCKPPSQQLGACWMPACRPVCVPCAPARDGRPPAELATRVITWRARTWPWRGSACGMPGLQHGPACASSELVRWRHAVEGFLPGGCVAWSAWARWGTCLWCSFSACAGDVFLD
jgi:hypothetical protein